MPKGCKMLWKSIQNETKIVPNGSLGPPGGHPVENTSRRRLQDTPWTSHSHPKSAKRPPNPSPNRPQIVQKPSKKPDEISTRFSNGILSLTYPKIFDFSSLFCFLDALGDENRWSNENIDFREFALPLQREHGIYHVFNENLTKFRFKIASEIRCNLISRFSLILPPKCRQNDLQMTLKST